MTNKFIPSREVSASISRVLMKDWDPIGVSEIPEASDEYDPYVPGIYRLIAEGCSADDIARYLQAIETKMMGLEDASAERRVVTAGQLLRLGFATLEGGQ